MGTKEEEKEAIAEKETKEIAQEVRKTVNKCNSLQLVLGRVKDSSSHDSILFTFFAGEREDSSL
jgi:hypothetical protein